MYYSFDALGNLTDLTDRTGETITQFRFSAFGSMYAGTLAPYNFMGLTGKHYDPKSGLVDFDFRWYDPQNGRFTQVDTFKGRLHEPGTQHAYAYVGNNPINYIDPDGHEIDYDDLTNEEIQEILDDLYGDGDSDEDSNDGGSSGGSGSDDSGSGDDDDYDSGGSSGGSSDDDDDDDDDYSPPPPTTEEKQEEFNSNVTAIPNIKAVASYERTTSRSVTKDRVSAPGAVQKKQHNEKNEDNYRRKLESNAIISSIGMGVSTVAGIALVASGAGLLATATVAAVSFGFGIWNSSVKIQQSQMGYIRKEEAAAHVFLNTVGGFLGMTGAAVSVKAASTITSASRALWQGVSNSLSVMGGFYSWTSSIGQSVLR